MLMKEIPVRIIDEAVRNLWQRKPEEVVVEEVEEKVITLNADYKTWIMGTIIIIALVIIITMKLQDTGLQDNLVNIQKENLNISKQNTIQMRAEESKIKSKSSIDASRNILQEKYHVIY